MKSLIVTITMSLAVVGSAFELPDGTTPGDQQASQKAKAPAQPSFTPEQLDGLLAPIALYPDALLAQMLMCSQNPAKVGALHEWLASQTAKGTELQDAATKAGFAPEFAALVLFPDVVNSMASQTAWTTQIGQAFSSDRGSVFGSIQRLRAKAHQAGKLKDTPQQDIETKTTSDGQQVIVIEPTNPQVVYVPQYNPTTVYTPAPTTVVVEDDDSDAAVAAGLIGFTAGIALGAAFDNDYYYGPYGWRGGGYMYNDAWDDYYDYREDAREDWMDHREDVMEDRGERARETSEQRTERRETTQQQRTERTQARQTPEAQAQRDQRRADAQATAQSRTGSAQASTQSRTAGTSQSARGYSGSGQAAARSGTKSDAFSGYSSGRSTSSASQRGNRSRSSSSRGGGGRRR